MPPLMIRMVVPKNGRLPVITEWMDKSGDGEFIQNQRAVSKARVPSERMSSG